MYSALALVLRVSLLEDLYLYVPVASELVTGAVSSFVMHLLTIGFREKFTTIVIE